jgi:hypothetical protein
MNPQLQQVLSEIAQLAPEERSQLIAYLHRMQPLSETEPHPRKSWQDLEGIAPNLLNRADAQAWVNQIRDEWGDRDQQFRG